MRLIDADALTKEIKMDIEDVGLQERMIFYRINNAPSADTVATFRTGQTYGKSTSIRELVEVVRCKDCKYRRENCGMGDHRWCDVLKMTTMADDFCSYGKRREP